MSPHSTSASADRGSTHRTAVVIPTLDEEVSIGSVIRALPRDLVSRIIVADGGSVDATVERARAAGADVIAAGRGYGRACLAGAEAATDADIVIFMDGDGADDPASIGALAGPIRSGEFDFVIASRSRGTHEPGSIGWHQIAAGWLAGLGMRLLYGVRYTDMCAFRAIRRDLLLELGMRELTYGWNIEMQMRAARSGLRILEIPVPYRRRTGGASKVAGSLSGTVRAAARIVAAFVRVSARPAAAPFGPGARRMMRLVKDATLRASRRPALISGAAPLLERNDHVAPSIFRPENLLREARRQKGLAAGSVPPVCVLDPDGDIVAHVRRKYAATRCPHWACYHTTMWTWRVGNIECGIIGHVVGGSFAVLVAEQLFASGCGLLLNIASAGQITDIGPPPYYILIERALRDEGTSYHYLPSSNYVEAVPALVTLAADAMGTTGQQIFLGDTWTTDAPFRETAASIASRRADGILAVEMEAAALYAFAVACARPVVCLAHVSNQLGCVDGDFEKGDGNGAAGSFDLVMALAAAWRRETQSSESMAT